jgi:carbon monoxide dehydrogenase subunit G
MKFTGQETFPRQLDEVWGQLTDLACMASIIPDLDRVEEVDSDHLLCRVKPAFAFLAGSLQLRFSFLERNPENHLKILVVGKKIGAGLKLQITISLTQEKDTTCLRWEAEILERTGLLKPIGNSLLQATAEKVIASTWASFRLAIMPTDKAC